MHIYTNEHPEIVPYIFRRDQETIVVSLNQPILEMEKKLFQVLKN